ncbi:MAG: DUF4861 family protein [Ignavibacteriae bacterium]|nr:DUF4861 family protein [Ignavibacteriota bacterium]
MKTEKSNFIKELFIIYQPRNEVEYAIAAAWELEKNGIKNKIEFEKYINDELTKLNNPLKVEIK